MSVVWLAHMAFTVQGRL